jgi:hypothetical protein
VLRVKLFNLAGEELEVELGVDTGFEGSIWTAKLTSSSLWVSCPAELGGGTGRSPAPSR